MLHTTHDQVNRDGRLLSGVLCGPEAHVGDAGELKHNGDQCCSGVLCAREAAAPAYPSLGRQRPTHTRGDIILRQLILHQLAPLRPWAVEKAVCNVHELWTSVKFFILRVPASEVAAEQVPGELHE